MRPMKTRRGHTVVRCLVFGEGVEALVEDYVDKEREGSRIELVRDSGRLINSRTKPNAGTECNREIGVTNAKPLPTVIIMTLR